MYTISWRYKVSSNNAPQESALLLTHTLLSLGCSEEDSSATLRLSSKHKDFQPASSHSLKLEEICEFTQGLNFFTKDVKVN